MAFTPDSELQLLLLGAKLKVLPADWWMPTQEASDTAAIGTPCRPLLNRLGIYLISDYCWYEANGGAWLYSREQFKFKLNLLNASELSDRQASALEAIVREKLATRKQIEMHNMVVYSKDLKHTLRQSALWRIRMEKHGKN